jgi:protein-export membrane protein SecD
MKQLKYRFITIAVLLIGSVIALFPRDTVVRVLGPDGQTFVFDTVKRFNIKLGLDLRGGMYIALEPDESAGVQSDVEDKMDRAVAVVRNRLDGLGIAETTVQKQGTRRIIVELPGVDDPQRAVDLVGETAYLEFKITDKTDELDRAIPQMERVLRAAGVKVDDATSTTAASSTALKMFGTDSVTAQASDSGGLLRSRIFQSQSSVPGEYRVRVDQFRLLEQWFRRPEVTAVLRPGKEIVWGADSVLQGDTWYRRLYVVDSRPVLKGEDIVDATPFQDPTEGNLVNFKVNNVGGSKLRRETQAHLGDYMAIILDNRVMGQPPEIRGVIGTQGQITMPGKPLAEANDLALVLRAGALPVQLKVQEVRSVGASLGQDAIDQGIRAGLVGVAIVIAIMLVYYRFSGFLAIVGLVFYAITTLGMLAGLGAVLTLPGVAGYVLSIGMAVDSNFLIFERIREELLKGKTVRTAIDEGFNHAWSAIIDTHATTALTAAILFNFGTGPVKGFAVALLAGILSSLVSAIFVVRTLYLLWLSRSKKAQTLSI